MIYFEYEFGRMGCTPAVVKVAAMVDDPCYLEDVRDEIRDALPSVRVVLPGDPLGMKADLLFLCAPNVNLIPLKTIIAAVRRQACQETRWIVMYSVPNRRWQAFPRNAFFSWALKRTLETTMRNIARRSGRLIRIPERWL